MATIKEASPAPWRLKLVPAVFSGVVFHIEQQARSGGRRVVLHEYPKRDTPYAEDMGRHAFRYQITGYIVGPNYDRPKKALMRALDDSAGGEYWDQYLAEPLMVICERYSVTETRQRGGFCTFEMTFVELGTSGNSLVQQATEVLARAEADKAGTTAASRLDTVELGQAPNDWPTYGVDPWPQPLTE